MEPDLHYGQHAPAHDPQLVLGPGAAGGRLPMPGWPVKPDLDYIKVAIEVLLLLLAIPWLIKQFVAHPGRTAARAGRKHVA